MLAGGMEGRGQQTKGSGQGKNRKDQQVPPRRGCGNTQLRLWAHQIFFVTGAATRLIQRVDVRLCHGERGTLEEEQREKQKREHREHGRG